MITVYQTHQNSKCEPHFAQDNRHSKRGSGQWLGNGYYFWEHILFAKFWTFHKQERQIYCAELPFHTSKDKFLDLHSNTDDMIDFYTLIEEIRNGLIKKAKEKSKEGKNQETLNENPTLNQVITFLHSRNYFKNRNYIGIRFGSPWYRDDMKLDITNKTNEKFYAFQKIQFCIFEFSKDEIKKYRKAELTEMDIKLFSKFGV